MSRLLGDVRAARLRSFARLKSLSRGGPLGSANSRELVMVKLEIRRLGGNWWSQAGSNR
jgi:hypothetical protein